MGRPEDVAKEKQKIKAEMLDSYSEYGKIIDRFINRENNRNKPGNVTSVEDEALTDVVNELHPVSYATDDSLLGKMGMVIRNLKDCSINFEFLSMRIWSNYFKNESYKNEKEFRLLFENQTPSGWLIEDSKKIIVPYIDMKLRKDICTPIEEGMFPLALTHVILGPNIPSKNDNMYQIQMAADYYGKIDFKVHLSREATYR